MANLLRNTYSINLSNKFGLDLSIVQEHRNVSEQRKSTYEVQSHMRLLCLTIELQD